MLVKFSSRLKTESITSLTLLSAAATCACKNIRVFPICAARRSVGVGDFDLEGLSERLGGEVALGEASAISLSS